MIKLSEGGIAEMWKDEKSPEMQAISYALQKAVAMVIEKAEKTKCFSDIDKLGHSIAAAFVATLLGIFTGYVCWHPFANKLKRLSAAEVEIKKMILEGALALQSGASSLAMEAKLQAFIPVSERKQRND